MGLNALILGAPNVVSMGIARGWQMAGNRIAAIWCPDREAKTREFARDRALAESAPGVSMHGLAQRTGVPMRAVPPLLKWPEANAEAAVLAADLVISLLFTDRIPRTMLNAFSGRVLNLHPSLLPAYRGRWPVFNMLWDRSIDTFGGMSLHVVAPEFDTGDMLGQAPVRFPADRNLSAYYMHLVKAGAALLADSAPRYLSGALEPAAQMGEARQSNRHPHAALLSAARSAEDVEWLCATIPQYTPLRIEGAPHHLAVERFVGVVGAATGSAPSIDGAEVTFDACDARVCVLCSPSG